SVRRSRILVLWTRPPTCPSLNCYTMGTMAQDDREALCSIFRATNGPDGWFNTEGWNTVADLKNWFGVRVNAESRVVGLRLGDTYHRRDIDGRHDAACTSHFAFKASSCFTTSAKPGMRCL
ncbi:unnamed protein product, partial [Ascophyllum nodosum]